MGTLTWSLADPELDILGRVGLGAMALAIDAAAEMNHSLDPLSATFSADSLTLSWPDQVTDMAALTALIDWAWQARGGSPHSADHGLGVLWLPGIHRAESRDDIIQRLPEHAGILSTFLQHPRTQRKSPVRVVEAEIDNHRMQHRFVEPVQNLAYIEAFKARLFQRDRLRPGRVTFSSFLRPGATSRHAGEDSWEGSIREAIPLLFAPTACFYLQLDGKDWVVVAPDPIDLARFVAVRPTVSWSQKAMRATSATEAGFRVLVALRTRLTVQSMYRHGATFDECLVTRIGEVAWNRQSVRNMSLRLRPTREALLAFESVEHHLPNQLQQRADGNGVFVRAPSPRSTVVNNLASGRYWYCGLFDVPPSLRPQVEKNRRPGESTERVWFRWLRALRTALSDLTTDLGKIMNTTDNDTDSAFRDAFHAALRSIYGREAEQAKRGSRNALDRIDDRTERIRRTLAKAQTRQHLRSALAEFFAEAGRNHTLQSRGRELWRFIDHPQDWKRVRDLALLSLATYSRPTNGDETANDHEEVEE